MIKLFNYLLISNIFTGAFVFYCGNFDFYISYIFMSCFLLTYMIFYRKININRFSFYVLMFIFILSLVSVFQGNNSIFLLLKVMIGFILNGVTYYLLIRLNDNKVDGLFRIYMQIACLVALIGIFQEISYLIGFRGGYDYRSFIPRIVPPYAQSGILRVTSIMQEPSHFGNVMAPAVFVSVLNIIRQERHFIDIKMSFLIIISILLSFSLVAYIGIVIALILIMLNYKRIKLICVSAIILFILMFTAYRCLPNIQLRVSQTVAVINGKIPLESANLSTFAFCSNGLVALKSFMSNPLFGAGLGSHPFSYDKYISQIVNPDLNKVHINREDASSMFLRIISETGLLGIFLFTFFIFRFYVSKKKDGYYWVISNAIFCLFVLNLLRQGNYFYNGFIFFMWAYYFLNKNIIESNATKLMHKVENTLLVKK
ncbi:MAG: hypothetical protein NT014_07170 [Candidatus Omnitrophica bacterium]|nr:hypothetical protein [Candidatus Omnitrophota bacterium]